MGSEKKESSFKREQNLEVSQKSRREAKNGTRKHTHNPESNEDTNIYQSKLPVSTIEKCDTYLCPSLEYALSAHSQITYT